MFFNNPLPFPIKPIKQVDRKSLSVQAEELTKIVMLKLLIMMIIDANQS